jgi:undecaprenyl-diphosphatase
VDARGLLQSVDRWTFSFINRALQNPVFDLLMPILSDKRVALLLAVPLVLILLARGGRRVLPAIAVAAIAIALSDQGSTILKDLFQRPRPCHVVTVVHLLSRCTNTFSMPSGHASNMFALAGVVWAVSAGWRWATLALAIGVAYSRIYLGVHYPGDVVLGAALGSALGWALMRGAIRLLPAHWFAAENPPRIDPSPESHPTGSV